MYRVYSVPIHDVIYCYCGDNKYRIIGYLLPYQEFEADLKIGVQRNLINIH